MGSGGRKNGWALVTGASRGLGLELARCLAADGRPVVLVARSEDRLRRVARDLSDAHGVEARVEARDLADPATPGSLAASVKAAGIDVEVLVNNAGFGDFAPFHTADRARNLEIVQINVTALTHLTRLFLPSMVEGGRGRILNMASLAAFVPGPLMAVYYASKAYVLSFSEAIAEEVRGTGVTVTCLCPGPTETGFQERAGMEDSGLLRAGLSDPSVVARKGYRAMLRGERVAVPGFLNRIMVFFVRFMPRALLARTVAKVQAPRD